MEGTLLHAVVLVCWLALLQHPFTATELLCPDCFLLTLCLLQEVQALAAVEGHPNIVTFYDSWVEPSDNGMGEWFFIVSAGWLYITMSARQLGYLSDLKPRPTRGAGPKQYFVRHEF